MSQNSITGLQWFELAIKGGIVFGNVIWKMLDLKKKTPKTKEIFEEMSSLFNCNQKFVPTPHFAAAEREF